MTSGGLAAVSASAFAALYSAFGKYDVVHIHAEGPAFFSWLPKMFGKRVVVTIHGVDWQREKWQSGFGSKFIRQGEKNAVKYADEIIVLSKGVQDYFKETYGRETHFIPNGVNRPQIRKANLITEKFGLKKDSYILFLGRLVPEKGIRYLVEAFKNVKTDKKLVIAGGSSDRDSVGASIANQSSIVFTFEYAGIRNLFCGDAWAENIPGGKYDLVKLPHHGSIRNISDALLSRIQADTFLICADGTSHPNKQTIAKLLQQYGNISIYSNYSWWMNGFLISKMN